jgi:hypothetical protein
MNLHPLLLYKDRNLGVAEHHSDTLTNPQEDYLISEATHFKFNVDMDSQGGPLRHQEAFEYFSLGTPNKVHGEIMFQ